MLKRLPLLLAFAAPAMADAPQVVTDIAPIHSLVSGVMQGVGAPTLLVDAAMSPHTAALRPSQARSLQEADLIILVGEELTPWLTRRLGALSGETSTLALLESAPHLIKPGGEEEGHDDHAEEGHDDHEDEDHKDGDHKDGDHDDHAHEDEDHDDHAHEDGDHDDHAHEGGHHHDTDPHAWLDPRNAAAWTVMIGEALAAADPDNAATYTANAAAQSSALDGMAAQMEARFAGDNAVTFLAYHDAYSYFAQAFGHRSEGSLTSNEEAAPSAGDIKSARALLASGQVDCVFSEPQYSAKIVQTATEGMDVTVLELDPLGATLTQGADLYPTLLVNMAGAFENCAK